MKRKLVLFIKCISKKKTTCCRFYSQKSQWKTTIGLEVHAQIASSTKLFSSAEISFASPINSKVNLVDAGIPGTLPVLNENCVRHAVRTSLALKCDIHEVSHFDRKHYFYADLPVGYQITQQRSPVATNGNIEFFVYIPGIHEVPYKKSCRLKQIQLEQDSGKSLHDMNGHKSLIDLNRAGVGLMEFVFEPDLTDSEEAAALVRELVLILQRLKSCSCKMEEGALRVDANVSVSKDPAILGVRTEIKNIGSVRGVANAIKFESLRQTKILEDGGRIINETRGWDPGRKETISMRDKEEKQDYRFMPEPNLPPLRLCVDESLSDNPVGVLDLRTCRRTIPEMPAVSRKYLLDKYGLSEIHAIMLVNQSFLYDCFNEIMKENSKRSAKILWNILMVQLLNVLNQNEIDVEHCSLHELCIGEIVDLMERGQIDWETAKSLLDLKVKKSTSSITDIIESNDWYLVSDPAKIDSLCLEVLARNPKELKKYHKGKTRALQAIINDVANLTKKKINLSLVSKRLKEIVGPPDAKKTKIDN